MGLLLRCAWSVKSVIRLARALAFKVLFYFFGLSKHFKVVHRFHPAVTLEICLPSRDQSLVGLSCHVFYVYCTTVLTILVSLSSTRLYVVVFVTV